MGMPIKQFIVFLLEVDRVSSVVEYAGALWIALYDKSLAIVSSIFHVKRLYALGRQTEEPACTHNCLS